MMIYNYKPSLIAAIILLIFLAAGSALHCRNIEKITASFFEAVKTNNYAEAYKFVSREFKDATGAEALKDFIVDNKYNIYENMNWPYREVSGESALMKGRLILPGNIKCPLIINFVKEYDEWKIFNIKKLNTESEIYAKTRTVPAPVDLNKLAFNTFSVFAAGINKNDFTEFYNSVSHIWKPQTNPNEFKLLFAEFVNKKIDLTKVGDSTIQLNKDPEISEEGFLILEGIYPSIPDKTKFELKYNYDPDGWKLISIDIETK